MTGPGEDKARNSSKSNNGRKGRDKNEDEEQSPCGTCKKIECTADVGARKGATIKTKMIQCDGCSSWYHGFCQELETADVNMIGRLEPHGVKWFCTHCISLPNADTKTNVLNDPGALSKLGNIEQMVHNLGKTYAEVAKSNTERIQKLEAVCESALKETKQNIKQAADISKSAQALFAKNNEINEAETRKNNAIMCGIEEQESVTTLQQIEDKMKTELFLHCSKPVQAWRLGRKEEGKNRPIKLRFEDEPSKWKFLKRVNNISTRTPGVYCKLDTSKTVRDQEYKLRNQMRELLKNDESPQYRIRNMKIEERSPTGEWLPANTDKETTI